MWQVSDGQKQILHLHVCGVATEDDVSSGSSHIFLIDAAILVVNPVHCLLDLKNKTKQRLAGRKVFWCVIIYPQSNIRYIPHWS